MKQHGYGKGKPGGEFGKGQTQTHSPAPGFARETGMPKDKQLSQTQTPNTKDPAGGAGRQKGDGAKE